MSKTNELQNEVILSNTQFVLLLSIFQASKLNIKLYFEVRFEVSKYMFVLRFLFFTNETWLTYFIFIPRYGSQGYFPGLNFWPDFIQISQMMIMPSQN